jgi:DNA-directed RNA polymerase specialized sigma24 family protein
MRDLGVSGSISTRPAIVDVSALRAVAEHESQLNALRTRDRLAFEQLCRECYPSVTFFLSLVLPAAPTEELCIDAFIEAWLHVEEVPGTVSALTWMFSVAFRHAHERAFVRDAKTLAPAIRIEPAPATSGSPFDVRALLQELPWEPRVIASLVYGMSFSKSAICWITGMTDRQVTEYLESARDRFRLLEQSAGLRSPLSDSTVEVTVSEQSKELI